MTTILCLAHYCDLHGPTPLMVTEGLPVPCSVCVETDIAEAAAAYGRPRSRVQTPTSSATPSLAESSARTSSSLGQGSGNNTPVLQLVHPSAVSHSQSAIETPPASPRRTLLDRQHDFRSSAPTLPSETQLPLRQSSFRKTYDDSVTKRIGPCENCALTLPGRNSASGGRQAGGNAGSDARGPTLRTRAAYARVYGNGGAGGGQHEASPPSSRVSSSSVSEDEANSPSKPRHRRTATMTSSASRSSNGSSLARPNAHAHYLDYTSTHEPLRPASFSSVRASCLRTLSFETLPRTPGPLSHGAMAAMAAAASATAAAPASPLLPPPSASLSRSPPAAQSHFAPHGTGTGSTGGLIFFGDPAAGYTTAYVFRVPDAHARGHRRVYAFLALTTARERHAMKAFPLLSAAFRDMSAWILALADAEAERERAAAAAAAAANDDAHDGGAHSGFAPRSSFSAPRQPRHPATSPSLGGSSFLAASMGGAALSRRATAGGGGGGSGGGIALKQRGLPELVGLPDFFIQLHARFVQLLVDVGLELAS